MEISKPNGHCHTHLLAIFIELPLIDVPLQLYGRLEHHTAAANQAQAWPAHGSSTLCACLYATNQLTLLRFQSSAKDTCLRINFLKSTRPKSALEDPRPPFVDSPTEASLVSSCIPAAPALAPPLTDLPLPEEDSEEQVSCSGSKCLWKLSAIAVVLSAL